MGIEPIAICNQKPIRPKRENAPARLLFVDGFVIGPNILTVPIGVSLVGEERPEPSIYLLNDIGIPRIGHLPWAPAREPATLSGRAIPKMTAAGP